MIKLIAPCFFDVVLGTYKDYELQRIYTTVLYIYEIYSHTLYKISQSSKCKNTKWSPLQITFISLV